MRRHAALLLALTLAAAAVATDAERGSLALDVLRSEIRGLPGGGEASTGVVAEGDAYRVDAPLALDRVGESALLLELDARRVSAGVWSGVELEIEAELTGAATVLAYVEHVVEVARLPNVPPPKSCRLAPELPICERREVPAHRVVPLRLELRGPEGRGRVEAALPDGTRACRVRLSLVARVEAGGGAARVSALRGRFVTSPDGAGEPASR